MAINLIAFVISSAIARARGLSANESSRLGLVGSIFQPPVLGIVLSAAIANSETPPRFGSATTTAPTIGAALSGGPPVLAIGAAGPPAGYIAAPTTMISFHGMDRTQAESVASWLSLNPPQFEGAGRVEWQEPGIGKPMPADRNLRLRLNK